MYRTKVTRKGQITIPKAIREDLRILVGDTVVVRRGAGKIIVEEPKKDIMELFGKWKWFDSEMENKIKSVWKGWDAKSMLRHKHDS